VGFGFGGRGLRPNPQTPNPQSPIPNPQKNYILKEILSKYNKFILILI